MDIKIVESISDVVRIVSIGVLIGSILEFAKKRDNRCIELAKESNLERPKTAKEKRQKKKSGA